MHVFKANKEKNSIRKLNYANKRLQNFEGFIHKEISGKCVPN